MADSIIKYSSSCIPSVELCILVSILSQIYTQISLTKRIRAWGPEISEEPKSESKSSFKATILKATNTSLMNEKKVRQTMGIWFLKTHRAG